MILANELDAGRSSRLTDFLTKEMRTAAHIFTGDYGAEEFQNAIRDAASKGKRAFLMNPPFGPTDESGYKLEHRVALKTIESAVPGDTLFFIGAAPGRDAMKMLPGALAGAYTSGAHAKFHQELNRRGWKASLHFIADGALYRKMGASFPVEVLLMEKTDGKEQNLHMPMRDLPARYSTWEQIRAAVAELYEPGAMTIGERVAAGLEANADAARAEAQGNAEASSPEVDAARENDGTADAPRYRLSQDIELGLVTPETGLPVSSVIVRTVYGKVWDKEFAGIVHNPTQLAERILSLPPEIAEARIRTADAIVAHLRSNPANGFNVSPDYVSMGPAMREAFEARWNAERPSSMEAEGGRAQVEYCPLSTVEVASPMKTPIELAGGIATALNDFADRHPEGIDAFVAEKMGWSLEQATDGRLDGSQIDALGQAIEKIDEGTGMIVGSMTGAGKGRVMGSVMDYHRKQGRVPIFLTAQAKLFTDIWRDLTATGAADDFKPLVLNDYKAPKSDDPDSDDEDAFTMPMFFTPVQRRSALSEGRLPQGANAIFLTYSQVQNPTASTRRKIDLIKKLLASGKGALVMDEAHLAAGADSNRGAVLREFADLAKSGVVFSSATFAKRGENMTLYKRAGYSQFFKNDMEMEQALLVGGVPFQQYLAARLTERGFYIRHELDYEGVVFEKLTTIDTLGTPQERTALSQREEQIADVYNQAVRTVMRFGAMVKAVNSRLQKGAPGVNMDGAAFMSSLHNTASFIYTALKAETVANAAVAELRAGRAPVITLYNTNQALLAEIGLNQTADVGRYLTRIAERAVAIQMPDGSTASILTGAGYAELVRLVKEQDARLLREAADALVRQSNSAAEYLREQNLPASPIDRVREIVENAGYQFGEVTRRTLMVRNGVVTRRIIPNPDTVIQQFNHGGTDGAPNMVLLLSSAGSTGLSAHASRDFRNQARRVMFVLQPSWDINEMMQMFGRVNRKNQVSKPIYYLVFTSAAGEQRNAAILMNKLRSLSANTSGVSKAGYGETVEDALDFMNAFGDRALAELTKERNPVVASINALRQSTSIRSATSISQFLPVREQEQFIGQIQAKVAALQDNAREAGLHDLEAGDIGRVPLSVEQLLSNNQMRAYEVPVLGRGKILTASEAVESARAWQAQHPTLLDNAKAKIDKAIADTSNPWLKRIYGDTARVL
ncbi:MAG TPA: strawberry notch C-terminal domain-containing protein, partial [Atopobiaceae bacterium]|nr:strawberry notch C-terminal domain-containing protein [Atopobiaceae bacterium]